MLANVQCLWEEGMQIPRWRFATKRTFVKGELRIEDDKDDYLKRTLRRARLFEIAEHDSVTEVLPPRHDAAVLWIRKNEMTITGFERDPLFHKAYAQTWFIEILPCA